MSPFTRSMLIATLAALPALTQDRKDFPVNNTHIVYHDVKVDSDGAILPWYNDRPSVAYDHHLRAIWKFWLGMRTCGAGIPYYLQHQVWMETRDDERGIGGDQIPMALDSWNLFYGYLGDADLHKNMIMMADYWLDHGMSAPNVMYANMPYPYDLKVCSGEFDGDMRAGVGYLQPDKAASFGKALVLLYKLTGNQRYLTAAVKIADTLVATVNPGDADHSPWPFRVRAVSGKVAEQTKDGKVFTATYTSNWTPALRLFSDLQALHQGNEAGYRKTAALVEAWLKKYPIPAAKWGPFFEDINTADYSDTEINADTLAAYILEHPDWGGDRKAIVAKILQWSEDTLGNHSFAALKVTPINEQTVYRVPGNSHTSRHASVELLYCEKTGDCKDKVEQIRRLNWATYTVHEDGRNRYPNDDIWLTDGYGDYVRNYLRAMAALPDLAPDDQNHLLRASSAIQHIDYAATSISYRKFDANSQERLKIGAGNPVSVKGGTFTFDPKTKVMNINANAREVKIELKAAQK